MDAITRITIPVTPRPDKLAWILDPKGRFSAKSVFICSQPNLVINNTDTTWIRLWKLNMHERLKMFVWRIGAGSLPTNLNFVQKIGVGDPKCPLCQLDDESPIHLFFHCQISRAFWFGQVWSIRPDSTYRKLF